MLIFAQLAAAALAAGGEAVASVTQEPSLAWLARLEAAGPRLRMDEQALCALADATPGRQAPGRWADGALARALMVAGGGEVSVTRRAEAVILEARLPPAG